MENNEDNRQMTALSELLNWIECETISGILPHPRTIRMKIKSLLPKEKEQIVDAFTTAEIHALDQIKNVFPDADFSEIDHQVKLIESGAEPNETAVEYYTQKYGTDGIQQGNESKR